MTRGRRSTSHATLYATHHIMNPVTKTFTLGPKINDMKIKNLQRDSEREKDTGINERQRSNKQKENGKEKYNRASDKLTNRQTKT